MGTAPILFYCLIVSLWQILSNTVTRDVYTKFIREFQLKAIKITHASNQFVLLSEYADLHNTNNLYFLTANKLYKFMKFAEVIYKMKKLVGKDVQSCLDYLDKVNVSDVFYNKENKDGSTPVLSTNCAIER